MKRDSIEMVFRQLASKLNINYRFHKLSSAPDVRWCFEWYTRIPGNPLNLHGWLSEKLHPKAKAYAEGWIKRFEKIEREPKPVGERRTIEFTVPGKFSKEKAVLAVLSSREFTSNVGIPCLPSVEHMHIYNDLLIS